MSLQLEKYTVAPGTPPTNILEVYAREDAGFLKMFIKGPDGGEVSLGISLPVSVLNGGTGSTTASGARANLGAAASGANSDITALSGLTTPLSIPQGGTGQISAALAYAALSPLTTKGDLQGQSATAPTRIPVGTNGQILTADSSAASGVAWAASAAGSDPLAVVTEFDDFLAVSASTGLIGKLGWFESSAGTAATTLLKSGVSGHPGILTIRPGSAATGRACISLGGNGSDTLILNDGSTEVTWVIRSASVLATMEMMVFGLGDTAATAGDQLNGVYFQCLGADVNWFIVTASGGTRTRVDTGILYVPNTWFKLKLTVNAGGTSVQANINGTNVGTAITTNIPTVAISPLAKVDGIVGGVASDTDLDFFRIVKTLTTAR